jgi:hypothetical protein
MEEFRIITECPNYSISNLGTVKNNLRNMTMKCSFDTSGYKHCSMTNKGKKITRKLHRLIAEAFIPNPENKECIDHINGIRTDNRIENLRWATRSENSQNKKVQSNNTLGHPGLVFDKRNKTKPWRAMLISKGIKYEIGTFSSKEKPFMLEYKKQMKYLGNLQAN